MRFAFIFVSPQLLLDQLARTRGAAGNSATPFLRHRLRLSFRQSLPFSLPFYLLPSLLPSSLFSTLPIGPASHCGWSRPLPHPLLPYTLSLSRPGLSLWQVPPGLLPPSPTSLPLSFSHLLHRYLPLYPLSISFILARLVIVIGPALRLPLFYLLSLSTLPSYLLHFSHLYIPATSSLLARLVIVAGPAHFSHFPAPSPSSSPWYHPSSDTPPFALHSGPACHCGRSRHLLLPLYISHTSFPRPSSCRHLFTGPLYFISNLQARLAIVAGPAFPIYLSFPPPLSSLPFIHTPPLLLSLPSHLGPAYHCGRSRPS